jgi:hypothetical protein
MWITIFLHVPHPWCTDERWQRALNFSRALILYNLNKCQVGLWREYLGHDPLPPMVLQTIQSRKAVNELRFSPKLTKRTVICVNVPLVNDHCDGPVSYCWSPISDSDEWLQVEPVIQITYKLARHLCLSVYFFVELAICFHWLHDLLVFLSCGRPWIMKALHFSPIEASWAIWPTIYRWASKIEWVQERFWERRTCICLAIIVSFVQTKWKKQFCISS